MSNEMGAAARVAWLILPSALACHRQAPSAYFSAAAASAARIAATADSSTYAQCVQWVPPCKERTDSRGAQGGHEANAAAAVPVTAMQGAAAQHSHTCQH